MLERHDGLDFLIVAGQKDLIVLELDNLASSRGCVSRIVGLEEAARLFSISVGENQPVVEPDIPIFLRPRALPPIRENFLSAFHYGECIGTLRAATALMKSPCINRTTKYGFGGRSSPSSVITEIRAGVTNPSLEVFSRELLEPSILTQQNLGVQDTITFDTAKYPNVPKGIGPYKSKLIGPTSDYEIVVVVGRQAWRISTAPIDHLDLEQKSIKILKKLDLIFGAITWSISSDRRIATVARVDPYPSMDQVRYVLQPVIHALIESLVL